MFKPSFTGWQHFASTNTDKIKVAKLSYKQHTYRLKYASNKEELYTKSPTLINLYSTIIENNLHKIKKLFDAESVYRYDRKDVATLTEISNKF